MQWRVPYYYTEGGEGGGGGACQTIGQRTLGSIQSGFRNRRPVTCFISTCSHTHT